MPGKDRLKCYMSLGRSLAQTDPVKIAIVQGLACFDTPTPVVADLKDEVGLVVARQQVAGYEPTKATGAKLSKKLQAIFQATHAQFLADVGSIHTAQQAYRLRVLQRNLEGASRAATPRRPSAFSSRP